MGLGWGGCLEVGITTGAAVAEASVDAASLAVRDGPAQATRKKANGRRSPTVEECIILILFPGK